MKTLFYLISVLFTTVILSCSSNSSKEFTGYIPVDQKPIYIWFRVDSTSVYSCKIEIKVVLTGQMDTITAIFGDATFSGSYAVRYRDTYPPAKNQLVYVEGVIDKNDGKYYIYRASLTPY